MASALRFAHTDKRRRPYWRDERLLGKTFIDKQQEGILAIGRDVWTRQEIIDDLHIGNMAAAHNLTKVARKLQVESLDQLTSRFTMEDLFAIEGFGLITMIVLMSAQEAKQKDPIKWIDKKPDELVTLSTVKHRVLHEQQEKERAAKQAKRATR